MTMQDDFEKIINENANILHKLSRVYSNTETEYEELFQEMMIRIWRSLPTFRGDSKLSTWLYKVCINTALSYRSKLNNQKMHVELDDNIALQYSADGNETNERVEALYKAIRELKAIDRAIITLYLDENSYEEISTILGISKTNVATKIMRIKKSLTEGMADYERK